MSPITAYSHRRKTPASECTARGERALSLPGASGIAARWMRRVPNTNPGNVLPLTTWCLSSDAEQVAALYHPIRLTKVMKGIPQVFEIRVSAS